MTSTLGPLPSELVYDPNFEELVKLLTLRPQMFVTPATYGTVCAFISGYDSARNHGLLLGLHPWLVMRANGGNNLVWVGLAKEQLKVESDDVQLSENERVIKALGSLFLEFFEYRRSNGITKIFHDYAKWLLRKSWYTGPLRQNKTDQPK